MYTMYQMVVHTSSIITCMHCIPTFIRCFSAAYLRTQSILNYLTCWHVELHFFCYVCRHKWCIIKQVKMISNLELMEQLSWLSSVSSLSLTTGNNGFAVRPWRTANALKRTANSLSCVFRRGARQRAHGSILHGKAPLPCVVSDNAQ
jgi:hypothetical protein